LPDAIRKLFKIKFPGGVSSVRFGLGMISFPIFYLLQGIMIYKRFNGDLWNLIIIIPLQYIFGKLSFLWYKSYKKLLAKVRYRKLQHKNSQILVETRFYTNKSFRLFKHLENWGNSSYFLVFYIKRMYML